MCCREVREKEKESARGTMRRGKREERLRLRVRVQVRARVSDFSINAIFIGKPSGSLCGGESSHFWWLDLIGINICNKSTWGSYLASFELSKFILSSKADEEKNKRNVKSFIPES